MGLRVLVLFWVLEYAQAFGPCYPPCLRLGSSPQASQTFETSQEEELSLVEELVGACGQFKRYGIDKSEDKKHWTELDRVCSKLEKRAPYLSDRETEKNPSDVLVGDWMVIGTTNTALAENQGITGLGKMPFTQPHKFGLFFRYREAIPIDESERPVFGGDAIAVELLEVFGKPSVKNELRGRYQWPSKFKLEQLYTEGDVGGQRNQPMTSAGGLTTVWISRDGLYRVGRSEGDSAWFVFKRLLELDNLFAALKLPTAGGSTL